MTAAKHTLTITLKHGVTVRRLFVKSVVSRVTLRLPRNSSDLKRAAVAGAIGRVEDADRYRGSAVIEAFTGLPRTAVEQLHHEDRATILQGIDDLLCRVTGIPREQRGAEHWGDLK